MTSRPSSSGSKLPVSEGSLQGPAKRQRLSAGTPEGGQANKPMYIGQLSSARADQERRQMVTVLTTWRLRSPKRTLSTSSRRLVGLWMSSLSRGSPPGSLIPIGKRSCHCGMPGRGDLELVG